MCCGIRTRAARTIRNLRASSKPRDSALIAEFSACVIACAVGAGIRPVDLRNRT
jgi:hypothetical protein